MIQHQKLLTFKLNNFLVEAKQFTWLAYPTESENSEYGNMRKYAATGWPIAAQPAHGGHRNFENVRVRRTGMS
jgi:hypothetical protein